MGKQLALLYYWFCFDFFIGLGAESLIFKVASEKAKQWLPEHVFLEHMFGVWRPIHDNFVVNHVLTWLSTLV